MTSYKIELEKKSDRYIKEISVLEIPMWNIDSHKYEIVEKIKEWLNIEAKDYTWTQIEVLNILNSPNKTLSFGKYAIFYDLKIISLCKKNLNLILSKQ